MERIEALRRFYARLITGRVGIPEDSELTTAFATTPRERFVSGPPWKIAIRNGYMESPSDDPAYLYQDAVVCLDTEGLRNNGQPSLHVVCLAAMAPKMGERVVHVGAGTGYYTTILAKLVGETGKIDAYEIDPAIAQRAIANLAELPQVNLHACSGTVGPLPPCDLLYINAGATAPLAVWLDALQVGGRMVLPMTTESSGIMLLVTRTEEQRYSARILCRVGFIPCVGARDAEEEERLAAALQRGYDDQVKALIRDDQPGESCWLAGSGWWLSTRTADSF
jgi:protein-L-isoaspartate(D-aspartate) O-methyltransferase